MDAVAYIGLGCGIVGAIWLWRKGQPFAPTALLLLVWMATDLLSRAIMRTVLVPWRAAHHPLPYLGFVRLAFHAHQACYLFASAGVCAYALLSLIHI